MVTRAILENLRPNDLRDLVGTHLHIDEFKSKMGNDADVCVVSFKVQGKQPAIDLVDFIEKAYPYVLDSDTSSGELEDGDYLVFIELERDGKLANEILEMVTDLENLTGITPRAVRFTYGRDKKLFDLTKENIQHIVPLSPLMYRRRFPEDDIKDLKTAAGIEGETKAPVNDYTESLRRLGGIN